MIVVEEIKEHKEQRLDPEYGFFMEAIRAIKHSAEISRAYEKFFGRKPSLSEKYHVASAYEKNRSLFGIRLKNKKFVKWIQEAINQVVPNKITVDGIFGYETVVGIMAAQRALGLRPTGVLDQVTFAKFRDIMQGKAIETGVPSFFTHETTSSLWLWFVAGGIALAVLVYFIMRRGQ
jgi:hypothetical protein